MTNRPDITITLRQEVSKALKERMSETKKSLKTEFKLKAKRLPKVDQKKIVDEMREAYFEPYQRSGTLPTPAKFSDAKLREYLEAYTDGVLAEKYENEARRRDLINQIVKYFHFAEMHEFFNKLKADLDKKQEEAGADTKNQILSKKQVQRTKDDNLTSLTAKQTGLLLKVLQEHQVFLGEGYLTKEDMYRIAQVTTGYGRDLVKKGYNKQEIADTDRNAVSKLLKNMANKLLKGTS